MGGAWFSLAAFLAGKLGSGKLAKTTYTAKDVTDLGLRCHLRSDGKVDCTTLKSKEFPDYEFMVQKTSKRDKYSVQVRKKQLQKRMDPYMRATGSGSLSKNTVNALNSLVSQIRHKPNDGATSTFGHDLEQRLNSTPESFAGSTAYEKNPLPMNLSERQAVQSVIRKSLKALNISESLDNMIGVYNVMATIRRFPHDTADNMSKPIAYPPSQAESEPNGLGYISKNINRHGDHRWMHGEIRSNNWHIDGINSLMNYEGNKYKYPYTGEFRSGIAWQIMNAVSFDDGSFDKNRFYKRFVHIVAFWTPNGYVTVVNGDDLARKQNRDQNLFAAQFGNAPHGFRPEGEIGSRKFVRVEFQGIIVDKKTRKDISREIDFDFLEEPDEGAQKRQDFDIELRKAMLKHHERRLQNVP